MQVSADSLNTYLKLPVVKVTVQSEQELYYFDGPIMKKGNDLNVDHPNGAKFKHLALDNAQTELALKQLDLEFKAEQRVYQAKLGELEKHRSELYAHTTRTGLSDYEEGKRRDRIKELTAKIAAFEAPEPINTELYRVQRAMLEMKLRESARLNASLLVWQALEGTN